MDDRSIAYFSMEIALDEKIPTYSGGLGILAGDMIRAAAEKKLPLLAVTLIHRMGYFHQELNLYGKQIEKPEPWVVEAYLKEEEPVISVFIEGRQVNLKAWKYEAVGAEGFRVPVYLLDADLPGNSEWDRKLTHFLYGEDPHYRLCQEVILGIGGVKILRALGYNNLQRFHMNEGHSSFLTLELLKEEIVKSGRETASEKEIESVRKKCVFTTHTPVLAGFDRFPLNLVEQVIGSDHIFFNLTNLLSLQGTLDVAHLAFTMSRYVNGVSKRNREVVSKMFGRYTIDSITNGVHAPTWTAEPFQILYDKYIPGWREDNTSLRSALSIPKEELYRAHQTAKKKLLNQVNRLTKEILPQDSFTIGMARRATRYKRIDLVFQDLEVLKRIAKKYPIQFILAGKAHPQDEDGKKIIQHLFELKKSLKDVMEIIYLENYDFSLARIIIPGVDLWLNTPQPPLEASGTSGMKAALNGVPSLSTQDGWWIEGCIEGVTGWGIGESGWDYVTHDDIAQDAFSLYEKLEKKILPLFYENPQSYIDVMRHAIALNGSFFNAQRMLQQYILNAYAFQMVTLQNCREE
ncbi:MAG: alpha-glucan family phosphorylase [Candidatus Eremiobacteraeota bacterium]|nr:alpha-glucan family phosphorylase [Candidatus Eremiobacteraeota bacterium]MCL5055344.1 alpha-glucan family phosphorylase [Bacillota bacterium]